VTRAAFVVLTGSGASADSGLATFRGSGGLWEGQRVEDVATPRAWRRDPAAVWRFYQERRAALARVQPNAAHRALFALEQGLAARGGAFTLATQNVDDLHERAGSTPLHVHGTLFHLGSERCGARVRDLERLDPQRFVPCAACGHARLRPDVVWFEERVRHVDALVQALEGCTHFLAIGTSGQVWPVAGLLSLAREHGARTIVNALEPPENLGAGDEFLPGRAAEVVPALVERLLQVLAE
jgi:NAD-dependent deacetylase